jgi:hypothetical protein
MVFDIFWTGNNISQKYLFYLYVVVVPVSVFACSTEDLHPNVLLPMYGESGLNSDWETDCADFHAFRTPTMNLLIKYL